jgi:hypothetical protein
MSSEWTILLRYQESDARLEIGRINVPILLVYGDQRVSEGSSPLCALSSNGKSLPKWAYEQARFFDINPSYPTDLQNEVTCNPHLEDPSNLWNIESLVNNKMEAVPVADYQLSFWEAFVEVCIVIFWLPISHT